MDNRALGLIILAAGAIAIVTGLAVFTGALSWFGRLPGDVRIEREGVRVYIPLASTLLTSIAISLLFGLLRRFF